MLNEACFIWATLDKLCTTESISFCCHTTSRVCLTAFLREQNTFKSFYLLQNATLV